MAYYDTIARQWHAATSYAGGAFKELVLNEILIGKLPSPGGSAILELGAGNGYFLPLVLQRFGGRSPARIVISDQSERLLGIARQQFNIPGAEYLKLDVRERFPFADAGFDLDNAMLDEVLRIEQEAWWQGAHVDPAAAPLLDALRRDGVRVGLCSNAPYRIRSLHAQLAHVGLDTHLDAVTFSAEVGWRKPSPRIFIAALHALGTAASGTVMVGDSEVHDIAGAHAAGMRAVLLRSPGTRARSAADAVIAALD